MNNNEKLLTRFEAEFRDLVEQKSPIRIEIDSVAAWSVLMAIQLATQHPEANDSDSVAIAAEVAREIQKHVAPSGALAEVAAMGWECNLDDIDLDSQDLVANLNTAGGAMVQPEVFALSKLPDSLQPDENVLAEYQEMSSHKGLVISIENEHLRVVYGGALCALLAHKLVQGTSPVFDHGLDVVGLAKDAMAQAGFDHLLAYLVQLENLRVLDTQQAVEFLLGEYWDHLEAGQKKRLKNFKHKFSNPEKGVTVTLMEKQLTENGFTAAFPGWWCCPSVAS